MGPIQQAIRANVTAGSKLTTPSQGKPFIVATIDDAGVALLLGAQRTRIPIRWSVLEGIGTEFGGKGWIPIGGVYDNSSTPGRLDAYMKRFVKTVTAGWVAALLEKAGVADIDRGRPACMRLRDGR